MRTTAWLILLATACGFACAEDLVYVSLAGERKIALYRTDHNDGTLKPTASILVEGEPGAMTTDPARRFLFASYRPEGKIASFAINPVSGTLTPLRACAEITFTI